MNIPPLLIKPGSEPVSASKVLRISFVLLSNWISVSFGLYKINCNIGKLVKN